MGQQVANVFTIVLPIMIIMVIIQLLVQSTLATPQYGIHSAQSVINLEEDDEGPEHDLDSFLSPASPFGSAGFHHSSGLDTISLVDHHLHQTHSQGGCEPIKIGMCMELGYNETTMPNLVGHDAQADADALLQTFTPLIQYGCSPHLKLFLCSSHAPMCTDKTPQPIGPCRSLCESVRRKCEPVLTEFGFKWPPSLECTKFHPENNHQHMCIPGPMDTSQGGGAGFGFKETSPDRKPTLTSMDKPILRKHVEEALSPSVKVGTGNSVLGTRAGDDSVEGHHVGVTGCQGPGKVLFKGSCWKKCPTQDNGSNLFKAAEMDFARSYTLPWAILSLFSATLALVLGVWSSKLTVAERPILYIAFCQMMFALGTIIGTSMYISCFTDKASGVEILAGKGTVPSPCALTFILTYFFGLASNLWWLIFCLSWMLALSMNLRISFQQKERSWSHLVAWATPAILSATALIYTKVEADELSGLCGIGFQDSEALTVFVLVPLGSALVLGSGALLCGGISRICPNCLPVICCFRKTKQVNPEGSARQNHAYSPVLVLPPPNTAPYHHHLQRHHPLQDHEDTSPSFFSTQPVNHFQRRGADDEKGSWTRIGIFAFVHIIPLASQVGGIAYEYDSKDLWENGHGRPNFQIFLLKLNMGLIPGLTAGVWVLSTISWKRLFVAWGSKWRWLTGVETKGMSSHPSSSTGNSSQAKLTPLLVPVPVNSLATTYISLGGRTEVTRAGQGHSDIASSTPFAGIVRPRYHQPPLPPLPARNPEPLSLEAWRRTETIV